MGIALSVAVCALYQYCLLYTSIQADVTDGAGETQQANLSLPLGSTSMVLNMDNLPDNLVKEKKLEIKLTAMNLSGEPVDTLVTYQVVEMEKQKDGQEKEGHHGNRRQRQ